MLKIFGTAAGLAAFGLGISLAPGCALGVAAGAGAVAADEISESEECDDDFDPLEDVRDKEDGCN